MNERIRVIIDVPRNKVSLIKMVRDFVDVGLADAKAYVESQWASELAQSSVNIAVEMDVDDAAIGRAYRRTYTLPYARSWSYISMEGIGNIANLTDLRENQPWT